MTSTLQRRWHDGAPPEVRQAVDPLLDEWQWLVPDWCHFLWLQWRADGQGQAGAIVNYQYRAATLIFRPNFLADPIQERKDTIIHELIHLSLGPMDDAQGSILENAGMGEEVKRLAGDRWTYALESTTSDLAALILRRFDVR